MRCQKSPRIFRSQIHQCTQHQSINHLHLCHQLIHWRHLQEWSTSSSRDCYVWRVKIRLWERLIKLNRNTIEVVDIEDDPMNLKHLGEDTETHIRTLNALKMPRKGNNSSISQRIVIKIYPQVELIMLNSFTSHENFAKCNSFQDICKNCILTPMFYF